MLDNEVLQAIGEMLARQKSEMMQEVSVLMESKFSPQFNLLAEGQRTIIDRLVPSSRMEELEDEVKLLKIVVRQLSEDFLAFKNAH